MKKLLLRILSKNRWIVKLFPMKFKYFLRDHFSFLEYDLVIWNQQNLPEDISIITTSESKYPFKIGIVKEFACNHQYYVKACNELKVSYEIIDISKNDWIKHIKDCRCDAFLVWPSANLSVWKEMFEERLKIIVEDLNKLIYPSYNEIWLYENKRRIRDWLITHNIPHPKTWIFYNIDEALEFLKNTNYPIVSKTNRGASASGVRILKNFKEAEKYTINAFNKGVKSLRSDSRDYEWGYIILQEYIQHEYEWRIAKIGDYYVYRKKLKVGNFCSGSGNLIYELPPIELLNFVREVSNIQNFMSMSFDIFEINNENYLINEFHTVFGAKEIYINENAGRYIYDRAAGGWIFEQGDFYRNACANLRVEYLVNLLLNKN